MPKLVKDVMRPGVYRKGPTAFRITADDIAEMQKSIKDAAKNGLRIPVWLEHPEKSNPYSRPVNASDAKALEEMQSDPWFGGWVEDATIDADGTLHTEIDVPDTLATRLSKTGTYVSPQFRKPDANEAANGKTVVFQHLALTRMPVNTDQSKRFRQTGIDENSTSTDDKSVLQFSRFLESVTDDIVQFSMEDAYVGDKPADSQSSHEEPDGDEQDSELTRLRDMVINQLAQLGIHVDANSIAAEDPKMLVSIQESLAYAVRRRMEQAEERERMATAQNGATGNNQLTEQAAIIAMSTNTPAATPPADQTKTDDNVVQMSQMKSALVAQDTRIKALEGMLVNGVRTGLTSRIDALQASGRCTAEIATGLKDSLNTIQFSIGDDGNVNKTSVEDQVALLERLPEGACLTTEQRVQQFKTNGGQEISMSQSPFMTGTRADGVPADVSDQRAAEILKEMKEAGHL